MKCVLFLTVVLAFAAITLAEDTEWRQKLKKIHQDCQSDPETHIEDSLLEKLKNHEKVDLDLIAKHFRCMSTKAGWQNEDGTINAEKVEKVLRKGIQDETKVEEAIKDCNKEEETKDKTGAHLWFCINKYMQEALHH